MINALDRALACRVQRAGDDVIGILKASRELAEQIAHPRVAMRLDNGDDAALGASARRCEDS